MGLDELPKTVRAWLALLGRTGPDIDRQRRALLADDANLEFAGQIVQGADALVAHQAAMPAGLSVPEWRVLTNAPPGETTVRGSFSGGPDGRTGPNGLSALDLTFRLDAEGRIRQLAPLPHHREPADLQARLPIGGLAPAFTLPDTDGRAVTVGAGAVMLVVWTCNHCPWALAWHDRLQEVARDYAGRVRTVQVNANDPAVSPHDSLDRCRQRVMAGEMASPYLIDAGQAVARAWGARHTPDAFVLDPAGRVVYHGAPDADHRDPALNARWLRGAIDAALAGQPANPAETKPIGCTIKWTFDHLAMPVPGGTAPISGAGRRNGLNQIELLYWADCPSHPQALALLRRVLSGHGIDPAAVVLREVTTQDEAVAQRFVGSPTIRIDGRDIVPTDGEAPALTCRVYRHRNGRYDPLPEEQDLHDAIRRLARVD